MTTSQPFHLMCLAACVMVLTGASAAAASARGPEARRVEWTAHRGESSLAPENTIAAVRLAWEQGADAVEFDVHLTRDGKLAVVHDKDLERTGKRKLVIVESTLDELRSVDVGSWKDPKYAGERVPAIDEVLATLPADPRKRLFIEVKVGPEAVPELAAAVKRSGKPASQLVVISFNADTIAETKRRLPQLKAFYLSGFKQDKETGKWSPTADEVIRTARRIGADGVDLQDKPPFDAELVRKAREAKMEVYAWTVDDPDAARRLIALGVDGITTNRPAALRAEVERGTSSGGASAAANGDRPWIVFEGKDGPGKGKHVVLVSGDEEYRSEEALPMLAKVLARHHGFKTTVLFAIDPKTGEINPDYGQNIPGLEALKTADLMVIATRFRDLPDEQMKHVVDYLDAGKPVIGLRTATHAFNIPKGKTYAKYGWNYGGEDYQQGFGKQVLGETWVAHHGAHGKESTRGVIADGAKDHPIARGLKEGEVWGPSDVYTVRKLPENAKPIVMGQVLKGMKQTDEPVEGKKNDPMMPVAWVRTYEGAHGQEGRVFTTTMGAATDLTAEGTRRMVVNAAYWALGMEDQIPPEGTKVDLVGEYQPTAFGFKGFVKGKKPRDYVKGAEDLVPAGAR